MVISQAFQSCLVSYQVILNNWNYNYIIKRWTPIFDLIKRNMRLILENFIDEYSYIAGYKLGYWNEKGEFEWADGRREIVYRVAENQYHAFLVCKWILNYIFWLFTVKPFVQFSLCLVPLMKLEKSRSSTKFDENLDYFLFE